MALITGLTKARLQEILDSSPVGGTMSAGKLQLTLRDSSVIDVGYILDPDVLWDRIELLESYILPDSGDGVWHYVGTAGEPAFSASCANYGGSYGDIRFRKDYGVVSLDGLMKWTGGDTISFQPFTLPVGYRPLVQVGAPCNLNSRVGSPSSGANHAHLTPSLNGMCSIATNGQITILGGFNIMDNSHVSLSGISFPLD